MTYDDYRHAKHLNDIIPTVLYNNPHCGYDRYDMGEEYMKYMQFPYTYSVETYKYDDDYYQNMASQFYFRIEECDDGCEKNNVTANTVTFDIDNNDVSETNNDMGQMPLNHK